MTDSKPESHAYNRDFMAYVASIADSSAQAVVDILLFSLPLKSVLDLGCGPGTWLRAWNESGVTDFIGVDGDYVQRDQLLIDETKFQAHDLSTPLDLDREFDMAYSVEVAEHIPESSAEQFIDSLTRHSKIIMFSAAVRGQGGEFHINEQPIDYWRAKFKARGYEAFDFVRPAIAGQKDIQRWYKYNTLLYVHDSKAADLPKAVKKTELNTDAPTPNMGDLHWKLRLKLLSVLSGPQRERLARLYAWGWKTIRRPKPGA